LHGLGLTQHVAEAAGLLELAAERIELELEPPPFRDPLKDRLELRGPQRLQEIVRGSGAQRLVRVIERVGAGDDYRIEIGTRVASGA